MAWDSQPAPKSWLLGTLRASKEAGLEQPTCTEILASWYPQSTQGNSLGQPTCTRISSQTALKAHKEMASDSQTPLEYRFLRVKICVKNDTIRWLHDPFRLKVKGNFFKVAGATAFGAQQP